MAKKEYFVTASSTDKNQPLNRISQNTKVVLDLVEMDQYKIVEVVRDDLGGRYEEFPDFVIDFMIVCE